MQPTKRVARHETAIRERSIPNEAPSSNQRLSGPKRQWGPV